MSDAACVDALDVRLNGRVPGETKSVRVVQPTPTTPGRAQASGSSRRYAHRGRSQAGPPSRTTCARRSTSKTRHPETRVWRSTNRETRIAVCLCSWSLPRTFPSPRPWVAATRGRTMSSPRWNGAASFATSRARAARSSNGSARARQRHVRALLEPAVGAEHLGERRERRVPRARLVLDDDRGAVRRARPLRVRPVRGVRPLGALAPTADRGAGGRRAPIGRRVTSAATRSGSGARL